MEERIGILMADLTGYTALTETHGALSAADLIDKYVDIVDNLKKYFLLTRYAGCSYLIKKMQ